MAKLFSLLLFIGYLAAGCERTDKNVEATACDPKVSKCAGKTSTTSSDQSPSSGTPSTTSQQQYPTDTPTPDPGNTTFQPTVSPSLTGGSTTGGGGSTTGGGGGSTTGGGGGSTTGGGGGSTTGGGGSTTGGGGSTTGGGGSTTGGGGSTTGGGVPTTSPSSNPSVTASPFPLQTIDPSFQVTQLGVTGVLDSANNLKLILQPQNAARFTEMTYSISVGTKIPGTMPSLNGNTSDANGFYDAGPISLNLMLNFKFDGKPCQSETNLVQSPTPVAIETRCRP